MAVDWRVGLGCCSCTVSRIQLVLLCSCLIPLLPTLYLYRQSMATQRRPLPPLQNHCRFLFCRRSLSPLPISIHSLFFHQLAVIFLRILFLFPCFSRSLHFPLYLVSYTISVLSSGDMIIAKCPGRGAGKPMKIQKIYCRRWERKRKRKTTRKQPQRTADRTSIQVAIHNDNGLKWSKVKSEHGTSTSSVEILVTLSILVSNDKNGV